METDVYVKSGCAWTKSVKNWWRKLGLTNLCKHIGLFIVLIFYTVGGGLVFREFESPEEKAKLAYFSEKVSEERRALVRSLSENTQLENFEDFAGKFIRDYEQVLQSAFANGLEEFEELDNLERFEKWTTVKAIFFSSTVLTTIGYGDIVPVTKEGRIFCIIFALVGIPLTLTVIADWGRLFASTLSTVVHYMPPIPMRFRRAIEARRTFSYVFSAVCFLLLYLAVGACLIVSWEDWTFLEGFYFCFVTMTTIGFGDLVPKDHKYMLGCTIYILIGLALTSTIIELVRRQYAQYWRQLQAFSGPLASNLRKLAENAPGLDVGAFQQDLWKVITLVSMPKRTVNAVKGEKTKQLQDWETAVEAVIRDMQVTTNNKPKQVQIVIYESSV